MLVGVLKKKILIAERFVGKNITLPILTNVLFEVKGQVLRIVATNLEMACDLIIHIKGGKDGTVAFPAQSLSSSIQSYPTESKILLEGKGGTLTVEVDTARSKIRITESKDFPLLPKIEGVKNIIFPVYEFQEALRKVLPAASTAQLKPELNGVFVSWNKGEGMIVCTATDTFRLAEKKISVKKGKSDSFSFILPLRFAQEIQRFETDLEEGECILGETQVKFRFGDDQLISNLTPGTFPQYQSIIPKHFDVHIETEAEKLTDAVRSTSFFSSKLQDILIRCNEKNTLEVHSENSEIGETTVSLPAAIDGKPFTVSFNHRFFLDGISALSGKKATILLTNESSPALIRDGTDPSFVYLVMPIKGV